jgi:hypothetical protein
MTEPLNTIECIRRVHILQLFQRQTFVANPARVPRKGRRFFTETRHQGIFDLPFSKHRLPSLKP